MSEITCLGVCRKAVEVDGFVCPVHQTYSEEKLRICKLYDKTPYEWAEKTTVIARILNAGVPHGCKRVPVGHDWEYSDMITSPCGEITKLVG